MLNFNQNIVFMKSIKNIFLAFILSINSFGLILSMKTPANPNIISDGDYVVSVSTDGRRIRLWDIANRQNPRPITSLRGHNTPVVTNDEPTN